MHNFYSWEYFFRLVLENQKSKDKMLFKSSIKLEESTVEVTSLFKRVTDNLKFVALFLFCKVLIKCKYSTLFFILKECKKPIIHGLRRSE